MNVSLRREQQTFLTGRGNWSDTNLTVVGPLTALCTSRFHHRLCDETYFCYRHMPRIFAPMSTRTSFIVAGVAVGSVTARGHATFWNSFSRELGMKRVRAA